MNKPLSETNPHLIDPAKRAQDVARSVASSLAVEGVKVPIEILETLAKLYLHELEQAKTKKRGLEL